MAENPNVSPGFIRSIGFLGQIAKLTNQVCTRDAPGNVPLVIYDSQGTYVSGNGALIENFIISPTGTVTKSTLFLFVKFNDAVAPEWLYFDEIDLPALASDSTTTKPAGYPFRASLIESLYQVPPRVGTIQYPEGWRLNGSSRNYQVGLALSIAIGSDPIIVWAKGGEL